MNREISTNSAYDQGAPRDRGWVDPAWAVGLLLSAVILLTVNLGSLPLRDWDEGIVAQIAREMVRSPGEALLWLYPKELSGNPYFNKPPLIHWLVALSYRVGGMSEWTSRLPGAVLTALSVPVVYGIGREVFFRRSPAVLAALVYLTSLPVIRNGRLAMLDGAVLCWFTLMMWFVLRSRRDLRWGLGIGISFGLICLTKGMLGVLLGAIALGFLAWDTPRVLASRYLWGGFFLGCVPVALWYGAQIQHYGQLFIETHLLDQSLKRISDQVSNNRGAIWFYGLDILKNGVPWVLFLPAGFRYAWEHRNLGWAKLVLVWAGVYFLVISVMQTKLPWYSLPLYPAFALVVGAQINRLWTPLLADLRHDRAIPQARIWATWFTVLAIAAWGLWAFYTFSPQAEVDLQLIFATLAFTLTVTAILILRHDTQFVAVLIWGMYLTLLTFVMSDNWVWELQEAYPVKPVAAMIRQYTPQKQVIYTSYPYNRPSLNFYSDRQVVPVSKAEIQKHWREGVHPYFLVEPDWLKTLPQKEQQVLGTKQGWALVARRHPSG
ncbi:ArnT family glycosyltransferase [Myxacorys almedinensis]|uniref:Phospholipid carrier-dependent glycosyltransferase n=1 Tax=Myxacorys almedinensis A TaxID=2690445 RepID=A0A8J7YWB0_9CYAN|nr:glycosyltransferase family 39 protein [Myxacorys almedinensis]NDJ15794.1 phospholipid carrier-dependent glycosyltransferase [Myxacorys almedinensis A]